MNILHNYKKRALLPYSKKVTVLPLSHFVLCFFLLHHMQSQCQKHQLMCCGLWEEIKVTEGEHATSKRESRQVSNPKPAVKHSANHCTTVL